MDRYTRAEGYRFTGWPIVSSTFPLLRGYRTPPSSSSSSSLFRFCSFTFERDSKRTSSTIRSSDFLLGTNRGWNLDKDRLKFCPFWLNFTKRYFDLFLYCYDNNLDFNPIIRIEIWWILIERFPIHRQGLVQPVPRSVSFLRTKILDFSSWIKIIRRKRKENRDERR